MREPRLLDHLVGAHGGRGHVCTTAAGDKVISPLPVALVEGRRRAQWYPPGTTDSLGTRKAKVLHQVNSVIAQSKIRRRPVDRFYARYFDLRQGPCRRFGRPHRRRLLRMCCKRPCRRCAAEKRDDPVAFHASYDSGLMLAARITLPHFSVSSAMSLPKSAGESASTSPLRSASRALSLGSARPALISLLSFATISAGVFLGAPRPYHVGAS